MSVKVLADCALCGRTGVEHYTGKRGTREQPEVLRPCVECRKTANKAKRGRGPGEACPECGGTGRLPHAKHLPHLPASLDAPTDLPFTGSNAVSVILDGFGDNE
jgi:hypothetical protein